MIGDLPPGIPRVPSRADLETRIGEQRERLKVIYHAHACLRRREGAVDVGDACPDHEHCGICRALLEAATPDQTIVDVAIMLGTEALDRLERR